MNLIKYAYKYIVKSLLLASISILILGLVIYGLGYNDLCINVLELGYWILFVTPLIPVLTLFIESLYKKDMEMMLTISIILVALIINIYFIGFSYLPFSG